MVYDQADSMARFESRVNFSIFDPPKDLESIPTKPGELSENQISKQRLYEKQEYAYQKYLVWEEKSKADISAAKTKWQKFWAYQRAPRCVRLEAKVKK